MKTIAKLILFGLVAGFTFQYLSEGNFNLVGLFNNIMQKIESLAVENSVSDEVLVPRDNDGGEPYQYTSDRETYESTNVPENDDITIEDAIEFPVQDGTASYHSFEEIKGYVADVPNGAEDDPELLVSYLVRPAQDDLEKARVIFCWIAGNISYDDNGYNTGNYGDLSAEGVLKSRRAVCDGFSELFLVMGKIAGLEIVKVTGYSKGITYKPGNSFDSPNHAWNAVKIDGKWKLFDVTWAQGYGTATGGKLKSVKEFDDFWFDTDPYAFIFSHFPENPEYQCIDEPISKNDFEAMADVGSSFFKMGFDGRTCMKMIKNGELTELPTAWSFDGTIRALSLPINGILDEGKPVRFTMRSDDAKEIAVINNGEWIKFKKDGDTFTADFNPEEGDLIVSAKLNENSTQYEYMLSYKVR